MSLDYEIYDLGDVRLQRGATLRDCKLAYKTFGTLNAAKDNVIVYPTWYSGQHYDNEWLIGEGRALDPNKYFIIIPNMLGNGLSSSPSNTPEPYNGPRFPQVTACDNVRVQHRLVTEKFGIKQHPPRHRLVDGRAADLPLGRALSRHDGPDRAVLRLGQMLAPQFRFPRGREGGAHRRCGLEGRLVHREAGDAACARRRASMPAGAFRRPSIARSSISRRMGYSSLEDFLVGFWEGFFLPKDANNLLTMLWTWQNGDISDNELYKGDFKAALGAIKAKAYVMPGQTDLYFPPEDSQFEVAHMPNAKFIPVPSIWGHFAGGPGTNPKDVDFIDAKLKQLAGGISEASQGCCRIGHIIGSRLEPAYSEKLQRLEASQRR